MVLTTLFLNIQKLEEGENVNNHKLYYMISKQIVKDTFLSIFNKLDFSDKSILPSEFAEKYIVLDSAISNMRQGTFSYEITPYMREIADCASPYCDAKFIFIMAGAQVGKTQGVIVPVILWKIANDPGNIVSLSATDELSKRFVEERIDPVIKRCFVRDLIRPSTIRKRNSRTGDTSSAKEFAGGSVTFGGLQSYDKMTKQRSFALGFYDDWDAAKVADATHGNTFELLRQRFSTAGSSMKQFFISTPETRPSNIELLYLMGDQRKWHVPCPCCNEYIEIVWRGEHSNGDKYGVVFEKKEDGRLIEESVGYVCQKCGGFFKEKHKYEMNLKGKWIPTAEPKSYGMRSYHIPCLIGAPKMFDWKEYASQWLRIEENGYIDKGKLKAFKNMVLGEPWEEKRVVVDTKDLIEHTRDYEVGVIPSALSESDGNDKIILLTLACDLNGTENDARLDWEVMAHSCSGSVYSINQGSIGTYHSGAKSQDLKNKGLRDLYTYHLDEENSVWTYLENEVLIRKYYTDDNREMRISFAVIDDGHLNLFVHQFVEKYPGFCVCVKGKDKDKYTKPTQDIKTFKPSREKPYLYLLEVDKIKDEFSDMLSLPWDRNSFDPQPAGYVNYPTPNYQNGKYTLDYFKQLSSEQKEIQIDDRTGEVKAWKWVKITSSHQNHFWDCSIYNIAARDIFMTNFIKEYNKKSDTKLESTWFNFANIIKELF